MATTSTATDLDVHYPESDGQPMAETPLHRQVMTDVIAVLEDHFANEPDVYVSGNMFVYYVQGQPGRRVAPDVMVVRGVDKRRSRRTYMLWKEGGKTLDLVVEVSSLSTSDEDLREKFRIYRDELRVREYFLFDPEGEYLDPPLRGFRLGRGRYSPIKARAGRLPSDVLGLHLEGAGETLRLFDPAAGLWLLTRREKNEQQAAELQLKDAEIERLRRELDALRRGKGRGPKRS